MRLMQHSASRLLFPRASRRVGCTNSGLPCKQTLPDRPTEFTHPTRVPFARLRQRSDFLAQKTSTSAAKVPAHVNEPAITFERFRGPPSPYLRYLSLEAAQHEAGVVPAEAERVGNGDPDVGLAGFVRDVVEVALGVRRVVVDRRRPTSSAQLPIVSSARGSDWPKPGRSGTSRRTPARRVASSPGQKRREWGVPWQKSTPRPAGSPHSR